MSCSVGASLPRSLLLGSEVSAAQSSGEWPGVSVTWREDLVEFAVRPEGAKAALEKFFVGGTRSDAAAEGGGRSGALAEGRGGGSMELKVGGFNCGGLFTGGALRGEGASFVDAPTDEGNNTALGMADGGEPSAGTVLPPCAAMIDIDSEDPGNDGSCLSSPS